MAIRNIVQVGDDVLRQKCEPVEAFDEKLWALLDDMKETVKKEQGAGLAAPQIGISKKIVVIDIAHEDEEANPLYFVNPEIIWRSDEKVCAEEGCLSIPGQRAEVERHYSVKVKYLDYNGVEQEMLAEDFLAKAVQHELDHLDGILYIDHLSRLKRQMLLKKLEKFRKENSGN